MKTGIELIAKERQEQIEKHGRTIADDVKYNYAGQLAMAAEFLMQPGEYQPAAKKALLYHCPSGWDETIWLKMCYKNEVDRKIIAGALMAAEIDRLQNT